MMTKLSKLYFLLSFTISLIGSQQPVQEFSISTSVERLNPGCMVYCDAAYVNFCNQKGIKCITNEPFIPVFYSHCGLNQYGLLSTAERMVQIREDYLEVDESRIKRASDTTALRTEFQKITHLPYSLFHNGAEFKKEEAELFRIERVIEGISYRLKASLSSDFKEQQPEDLLNKLSFREYPNCMIGGLEARMLALVDTDSLEKELIQNEILAEIDGKLVHGPKGYFGIEEYNKKLREYRKKLFFSYTKNPFLGFSFLFSCYLLWTIYSKYS